ncbi:imm11 family protein [Archangium violaceum]|uniref:Immunity MXAN-0049 protein domain-containing protein n=1 Tax=Archangium violaceum Cb vi76 TaxID=1406225 RepID=A0A084SFI2_9BACT|nr:DUF1629 domain-containing protein [Archangium violaceum]KFA87217.1 hypothetical protein Q664_49795 [Archangium violaceum Cb vi76]
MNHTYYTFKNSHDPRAAEIVELPDKVEKYYYLKRGRTMKPHFPPSTALCLYEEAGDMLTDFISNPDRVLYVSRRTQELLVRNGLPDDSIEYLPFVLHDKRGRVVREQYYIANPLMCISCFDLKSSRYWLESDEPPEIGDVEQLRLREDQLPADAKLFRVAEFPRLMVIRSDLLEAMRREGLTGLNVQPVGESLN